MGKTITTHNGSAAHRAHNIRDPKATDKQEHIDKSLACENEILIDEPPREAYRRIFGQALDEYNAMQDRPERRIKDYYSHVDADGKKHPVYEMIVQVGDKNDTGIDAPREREIIKEFINGWSVRNPNLELIGAYIHADEREGTLHAHLDYVPVAHGYRNGLSVQNGLVRALGEQGIETVKRNKETAQIRWEARENAILETICNRHGIEVDHPKTGRKHLNTPEYKEFSADLDELRAQVTNESDKLESDMEALKVERSLVSKEREALRESMERLQADKMSHEKAESVYKKQSAELKDKSDALRAKADAYNGEIQGRVEIREIDKRRTGTVTGRVSLTADDYNTLKTTALYGAYHHDTREEHEKVLSQNRELQRRVESSKISISDRLQGDNQLAKENSVLKRRCTAAEKIIQKHGLESEMKVELTKSSSVTR